MIVESYGKSISFPCPCPAEKGRKNNKNNSCLNGLRFDVSFLISPKNSSYESPAYMPNVAEGCFPCDWDPPALPPPSHFPL